MLTQDTGRRGPGVGQLQIHVYLNQQGCRTVFFLQDPDQEESGKIFVIAKYAQNRWGGVVYVIFWGNGEKGIFLQGRYTFPRSIFLPKNIPDTTYPNSSFVFKSEGLTRLSFFCPWFRSLFYFIYRFVCLKSFWKRRVFFVNFPLVFSLITLSLTRFEEKSS